MLDRKWQYKVHTVKINIFTSVEKQDNHIQEELNQFSMQGWELNKIEPVNGRVRLYLRR